MSKSKIKKELIDKVKILYPDCDVFKSRLKLNYICIRKLLGQSVYYKDENRTFEYDNTSVEYLYITDAILETNKLYEQI